MPTEMYIPIALVGIIMLFAIVITVLAVKNYKQHITHNFDGHTVEIVVQFNGVMLIVDGKTVDELRSYQMRTAKLQATLDGKTMLVNIGAGFIKPKIITFINGEKIAELSNC